MDTSLMDPRVVEVQRLHWRIRALSDDGRHEEARPLLLRRGELERALAEETLARGDSLGLIDLYSAATAFVKARDFDTAGVLLDKAVRFVKGRPQEASFLKQAADFDSWMTAQRLIPAMRPTVPANVG